MSKHSSAAGVVSNHLQTDVFNVTCIVCMRRYSSGMTESLIAGKVITLPSVGLFADGAAVKTVGAETFKVRTSSNYNLTDL